MESNFEFWIVIHRRGRLTIDYFRLTIDYCISPQRTPQLNRRKKAFNGAGKERREKILLVKYLQQPGYPDQCHLDRIDVIFMIYLLFLILWVKIRNHNPPDTGMSTLEPLRLLDLSKIVIY